MFEQAKSYAYDYMDSVYHRRVYPSEEAIDRLEIFHEAMPESSEDPAVIMQMLHKYGSPATVAETGGRYFGFVNGNFIPVATAAKWLTDVWDQNSALYIMFLIASKLRRNPMETALPYA